MAALLLDTYSLFFRSFHALPPMNTLDGRPTNAVYGFSALLIKLLREHTPSGVALALDRPEETFRAQSYTGYKAGRGTTPALLREQFEWLEALLDALAFPRFGVAGYEADDVLATLATELAENGEHVLIATGDRDLLQLVDAQIHVLFLGQRGKPPILYDAAAVEARFGVPPDRLPAYVALVGDPSDNIPKLKGMGPVTAQKLISAHPNVTSLLAHLDELEPRARTLLATQREQLMTNEALLRLRRDVPLPDGARVGPFTCEARERTRGVFEELEFKSLLPRLAALPVSRR